jgi:hypothetical protein
VAGYSVAAAISGPSGLISSSFSGLPILGKDGRRGSMMLPSWVQ